MESKEKSYVKNRKIAKGILILSALLPSLFTILLRGFYGRSLPLSFFQFLAEAVLIASVANGIAIYALTHKIPIPFRKNTLVLYRIKERNFCRES